LDAAQVRESALESLAENLNDSVIAPLCWFTLLGLPGAAFFRYADTADSMWGYRGTYRGQRWEWAGKWTARADDVLAWLPARLSGLALCLLGGLQGATRLRTEARQTPSPNSGWPMAAMALALGVRLRKPGAYTLNASGAAPTPAHVVQAIRLGGHAIWLIVALSGLFFIAQAWLQTTGAAA
ncbi:MAG: CobD/CbiB family cobalamin biosynthesis protein, partial [Brachymonas sp.]|nr:CobD/CbiB family cobalamin biosynthesis protein [Brachymonas sp.]